MIGKWAKGPVVHRDLLVLPAEFIDSGVGSGIVYSALEDPVDLFELKKIQTSEDIIHKYKLDKEYVKKLKPFEIIDVPGMGPNLGEEIGKELGVKSAGQTELLEKAKGELNRRVFRKGVMNEACGKFAGKTVPETQEILKRELVESKEAVMFYEPSGKVVCRCLTECTIKMVSDQWFLKYKDKKWKESARKALSQMNLYPELVRTNFEHVIGWLNDWACTHHHGTGTKLPWDEKWVIESLSDSTVYMAYYTISHLLNEVPENEIDDDLFDFILLGKENKWKKNKKAGLMKKEFEYWYPFDVRSSGKDLIQNHLTFCLFNHAAIFPEKYWPKAFSVNGWMLVEGDKMSKSKGNFYTIREIISMNSADVTRVALMIGGESLSDPNFDMNNAKAVREKLEQWAAFAKENFKKSPKKGLTVNDRIFLSAIHRSLKDGTGAMESMLFRTAFEKLFFQMQRALKDYMKKKVMNQELLNEFIEIQTKAIGPFCPFISEEVWNSIGKTGFVSVAEWPRHDESRIDEEAEAIAGVEEAARKDIAEIIKLTRIASPKKITLIAAEKWKYELVKLLKDCMKETRNAGEILKMIMSTRLKPHGQEISRIVPRLVNDPSKIPQFKLSQDAEFNALKETAKSYGQELKCKIEVVLAENSKEQKAGQAMPGKAAILIE